MTTQNELAQELFIADNSNQPRESSIVDWEWFESSPRFRGRIEHYKAMAGGALAAGYRKPRTIGYVVVGNQNNALDWDDQMYETVDSAIGSLCSPYQPFDRDPESPNFWGKEYRICPVSELEATK